jgi:hypothetical protein
MQINGFAHKFASAHKFPKLLINSFFSIWIVPDLLLLLKPKIPFVLFFKATHGTSHVEKATTNSFTAFMNYYCR